MTMTRPIKQIIPWHERVYRKTVWHPINTDPEDKDRWTPRLWIPTYDLLAILLGWYAVFVGSPLLEQLFPEWLTDVAGTTLAMAAIAGLIGVIIPRLGMVELVGKLVLVFLLGAYAGTVATLSGPTERSGFVVIVLIMALWILLPRVTVLFGQIPRIRAKRRIRKARRR